MEVRDIIKNRNFDPEFPFVVRILNAESENVITEFVSWNDNVPEWVMGEEVNYIALANGYSDLTGTPVMVIETKTPVVFVDTFSE